MQQRCSSDRGRSALQQPDLILPFITEMPAVSARRHTIMEGDDAAAEAGPSGVGGAASGESREGAAACTTVLHVAA